MEICVILVKKLMEFGVILVSFLQCKNAKNEKVLCDILKCFWVPEH